MPRLASWSLIISLCISYYSAFDLSIFWSKGFALSNAANGDVSTLLSRSKKEFDVFSASAIAFFYSLFNWKFGLKSCCTKLGWIGVYDGELEAIANDWAFAFSGTAFSTSSVLLVTIFEISSKTVFGLLSSSFCFILFSLATIAVAAASAAFKIAGSRDLIASKSCFSILSETASLFSGFISSVFYISATFLAFSRSLSAFIFFSYFYYFLIFRSSSIFLFISYYALIFSYASYCILMAAACSVSFSISLAEWSNCLLISYKFWLNSSFSFSYFYFLEAIAAYSAYFFLIISWAIYFGFDKGLGTLKVFPLSRLLVADRSFCDCSSRSEVLAIDGIPAFFCCFWIAIYSGEIAFAWLIGYATGAFTASCSPYVSSLIALSSWKSLI